MSTYMFHIANYHAVREATISLDGLTILAGVNGSGKSTIARLLHSTVRVLCDFDAIVDHESGERLDRVMENLRLFLRDFYRNDKSHQLVRMLLDVKMTKFPDFAATNGYCLRIVDLLGELLDESLMNIDEVRLRRYGHFFGLTPAECSNAQSFIQNLLSHLKEEFRQLEQENRIKKQTRPIADFVDYISSGLDSNLADAVSTIQFQEDVVDMITAETFYSPLKLRNVVYIDTQYVGQSLTLYETQELSDLFATRRGEISTPAKALVKRIQDIIGGDVEAQQENVRTLGTFSRYVMTRKNGQTFDLQGAATGEISFSYILQLIKNGWINEETLLIIDEPESHLHPQWIVDYANILVLVHQMLGTKVLISSHNPDMVSALQTMAEAEGVLSRTHFYLAEAAPEHEGQFLFTPQGSSIEKIFNSFNIALDRIDEYGRMG